MLTPPKNLNFEPNTSEDDFWNTNLEEDEKLLSSGEWGVNYDDIFKVARKDLEKLEKHLLISENNLRRTKALCEDLDKG